MPTFKERDLTKGQLRKLTALRKSLGEEIADKAFAEWLASLPEAKPESHVYSSIIWRWISPPVRRGARPEGYPLPPEAANVLPAGLSGDD